MAGYDAPESDLSVAGSERSHDGGAALDGFVDGLRTTHAGDGRVTAIGHSYGSTVVAEAALRGNGLAVDDIVTAGSPGMHTGHARDFVGINARHVWAGSAWNDPVSDASGLPGAKALTAPLLPLDATLLGYEAAHGESPHREGFGANRYVVDTSGHGDYWQEGTQSLDNQAAIIVGEYGKVGLVHGEAPTTTADDPPTGTRPPGVTPAPYPTTPATPTAPFGTPAPQPGPFPRTTP